LDRIAKRGPEQKLREAAERRGDRGNFRSRKRRFSPQTGIEELSPVERLSGIRPQNA
jgi:hypothetical protein